MIDPKKIIILYQELSNNAWPPLYTHLLNGWVLRLSEGVTNRANSVLPLQYSGTDIDLDISKVEFAYSSQHLPSRFMIPDYTAPSNLTSHLKSRNYQKNNITDVMSTNINRVIITAVSEEIYLQSSSIRTKDWYSTFVSCSNYQGASFVENYARIIDRIILPKQFFLASQNSKDIGVVLAVLERGYVGILDLVVKEDYRRMGVATALLQKVIEWGSINGAHTCYLQVVNENVAAKSFYSKLNFTNLFSYYYMTLD
ncbi:MAG: GNAT family N-acetyltransferase [Candidatus Heimdallarchaeota archaeon]|nr:GNAT family N-acetyltransferase [Candidatus Heimdallarchaeota archaeon]